jgi:hypothetical protein
MDNLEQIAGTTGRALRHGIVDLTCDKIYYWNKNDV